MFITGSILPVICVPTSVAPRSTRPWRYLLDVPVKVNKIDPTNQNFVFEHMRATIVSGQHGAYHRVIQSFARSPSKNNLGKQPSEQRGRLTGLPIKGLGCDQLRIRTNVSGEENLTFQYELKLANWFSLLCPVIFFSLSRAGSGAAYIGSNTNTAFIAAPFNFGSTIAYSVAYASNTRTGNNER